MNFQIQYSTRYDYDTPVSDNLNALRVRPATNSTQRCDDFHVLIDPEARVQRHEDYFGTEVIEFGIPKPHEYMSVEVRARVVTSPPPDILEAPWHRLDAAAYQEAAGEFLLPTGTEPPEGMLDELTELSHAKTPIATVRLLNELIPDRFTYDQETTYVGSTVEDLLKAGGGVCQDFVHLAVILLRNQGIAARYVSGYLWAAPEDGGSDSMEVHTHAWVEALIPAAGERNEPVWVGADPTNRRMAGETHVKIGHGRHYSDVPPIKGVYRGASDSKLDASVRMTRLDPQASARA